jgi:putative methionine-R-sulfoxide reductase with GAF domain
MADEILLRKAEYLAQMNLSWDELLRKMVQLLAVNVPRYHWVGIYLLEGNELVLHNYVGKPTEHARIPVGVGVCGTAVAQKTNQVIGDVSQVDNYLACSLNTQSEIAVLIQDGEGIIGQIDIDSDLPNAFGPDDESFLHAIARLLAKRYRSRASAGA